ncbi:MAG: EAL domain-containing protein [Magnetococcales bacterium]|nr:EAL domain-containing protein [Magnetococcales bacterium]
MPQRQPNVAQIESICILLVDDDQALRDELMSALDAESDFEWNACDDPEQALTLAREIAPDVVILETSPGGMDGLALIGWLHNLPETRHTPVIMLSSQKSIEWKKRAFAEGADDYLLKPIDPQNLALHIRRHVRTSAQFKRLVLSEAALRTQRDIWLAAQDTSNLGVWSMDLESGEFYWSDALYRLLGFQPRQFEITLSRIIDLVHPDDRPNAAAALGRITHQKDPINATLRIIHPENGHNAQIQILGGHMDDKTEDAPKRLVGTVLLRPNTTEQPTLEDVNLHRTIFEKVDEGVMVTDLVGTIQVVNPAFCTIFGHSAQEAVGQTPTMLRSDRHDKAFYDKMWSAITNSGRWNGVVWNRRKGGEAFPVQVSITTILDNHGQPSRYLAIYNDISDIHQSQEALQHHATHDALTGLPNRHLLQDRLFQSLLHAKRAKKKLGLLTFDIDLFKKINESLGHSAGDQILQEVAHRSRTPLRHGDTVCRMDGNTFAIILEEVSEIRDILVVVNKLFESLSPPFKVHGQEVYITISVGIAIHPDDSEDAETMVRNADLALVRAKDIGRNNFQFYTSSMDDHAVERLALESHLHKALEKNEFELHYQPKLDLKSWKIIGMESLVRWRRPDIGMVSPAAFIPLAEETGIIQPLGEWILETACLETHKWRQMGFTDLHVAVNLSARQLQDDNFIHKVSEILLRTGLEPRFLELEITESLMMNDVERAIRMLEELNEIGIQISVDDFGTGYSSLSYLKRFPIHTLKIDQAFVRDLAEDSDDAAIVSAIISLAKSLHLNVIAEGVETEGQAQFLRTRACDQIQGYLFSPPLPANKFEILIKEMRDNPPPSPTQTAKPAAKRNGKTGSKGKRRRKRNRGKGRSKNG